jgi:hypothetical protein
MIRHRTNRVVVAAPGSECPGCAALRVAVARLEKLTQAISRDLEDLKLQAAPADLEGNPRPPGNWVTVKQAADASGYDVSGIWGKVRRGEIQKWKPAGRVLVDIDGLLHKNKKTPCVLSTSPASMSLHLEESGTVDDTRSVEVPAHTSFRGGGQP